MTENNTWTAAAIYDHIGRFGPSRVVINADGETTTPSRARQVLKTKGEVPFDVVFIRDDGWSIGALECFESVARKMWKDEWVGELRCVKDGKISKWISIAY